MKVCNNDDCDGEWITYSPLQDGGLVSVEQCPVCAAAARQQAEDAERRRTEDEYQRLRRLGNAAGNMYAHLDGEPC